MELLEKIVLSEIQIQKIEQGGIVTIEATWDEFMDFLEETIYKAEYNNGKIIIMGLASAIHEFIVSYMTTLLVTHYQYGDERIFQGWFSFHRFVHPTITWSRISD